MQAAPHVAIVLPPRERFGVDAVGAIGLMVRRLAARAEGCAITVIGAAQTGPTFPGVRFVPVSGLGWLPVGANLRYALGVARLLRRLRPDLVEVHNRADLALRLARRWPVTLVLHNDPRAMHGGRSVAARRRWLSRLTRIVAVSGFLRDAMLDGTAGAARPVPAPHVLVIPNGLDFTALPPLAAERDKVLLFAGRLAPDKGAEAFVDACARLLPSLPGWRAEMIGADRFRTDSPETGFIRALRPRAAAAGIALRGYWPHEAVLQAMARAAIVVVPSRWAEPFGLTALEAMACGAALACSCRGGLAEVAGDACLAIDPDDPATMAAALAGLARDPAARAHLAEAGRARARGFDMTVVAALWDSLRRDILAEAARPNRSSA